MNRVHEVAAQTMAIDAVTVGVVKALRDWDIEPILLKGPSFASWLYGDGIPRPYNDTDLLIDHGVVDGAHAVLTGLGYEPLPNPPGPRPAATTWLKRGAAGSVDLHTGIWLFYETADAWRRLQAHTQPLLLDDLRVTVLDDVAKTVHVVTHALQHGLKDAGPIADLERALRLVPDHTWREAAALAAEVGAYDAFAWTLATWPGAKSLRQRIGVERPASPPAHIRLLATGVLDSGAEAFHHLVGLPRWRDRLAFLRAKVFPAFDFVESLRLPTGDRASRSAGYARYWLYLLRKAPRALRVWYVNGRRDRGS